MAEILIKKSTIEKKDSLARMNTDVVENGNVHRLFVEVEEEYSEYLCPELADNIVYLLLPIALREGYDIISETPVSSMFLHNINEILIPHLVLGDSSLHAIKVHAPKSDLQFGGKGVGASISCGVDSSYTIVKYSKQPHEPSENSKYKIENFSQLIELTHLFVGSVSIDLCDTDENANFHQWVKEHQVSFNRYDAAAKDLNLPIVKVWSNYFHFVMYKARSRKLHHVQVHNYITIASVLALKKLWAVYLFSSSEPFTIFNLTNNSSEATSRHELLSMHTLNIPGFFCFSGGCSTSRLEKTISLTEYPFARKHLHPCFSKGQKNCSHHLCGKCLRALLAFDYFEKLDEMKDVFDVNLYKSNRLLYLAQLVRFKDNEYLCELYELFMKKFPKEMKEAELHYSKTYAPVPGGKYNNLSNLFNILMDFYNLGNSLDEMIYKVFSSYKATKICFIGSSNIGDIVLSSIKNRFEVIKFMNDGFDKCECAVILHSDPALITAAKNKLDKYNFTAIRSLSTLHRDIMKYSRLKP